MMDINGFNWEDEIVVANWNSILNEELNKERELLDIIHKQYHEMGNNFDLDDLQLLLKKSSKHVYAIELIERLCQEYL